MRIYSLTNIQYKLEFLISLISLGLEKMGILLQTDFIASKTEGLTS